MATNDVMINGLIKFDIDDDGLVILLEFLYTNAVLRIDCGGCGLTIIPQARSAAAAGSNEVDVICVGCGKLTKVRMYGSYGFILPTDDEFYKGRDGILS